MTRLLLLFVAASAAVPPAQAGPPPAPVPTRPGVAITHQGVDCVVAAHHPVIDACFAPVASVGRAQVHFRAVETGPWYYVDMKPEGGCHRALLPKPRKETRTFRYFIQVIDREFGATVSPATAPDASRGPRVVSKKAECEAMTMMAPMGGSMAQPLVVGVARDAAGKLLDTAAAAKLERGASLGGFSPDGVKMASTGASPPRWRRRADEGAARCSSWAAEWRPRRAWAWRWRQGEAARRRDRSTPRPAPPSPAPSGALTGRWSGTAASGTGVNIRVTSGDLGCTATYDASADLTQSGASVTGPLTVVLQTIACEPSGSEPLVRPLLDGIIFGGFNATVTPAGGMTLMAGPVVFTGSYTNSSIDLRGTLPDPSFNVVITFRLSRR